MTTPRVTVPVEPTEAMKIAGVHAIDNVQPNDVSMWVTACWSAMLSAAPAPEGGAVDLDSAPNFGFETNEPALRQMVEHYYRSHGMDNWQRLADQYCAALATREEAPAEAGEVREIIVTAIAFLNRDQGTDRINATISALLPKLIRADAILRGED